MEREVLFRKMCGTVHLSADQLDVPEDVLTAALKLGIITANERASRVFTLNQFFERFVATAESMEERVREATRRLSS